MSIKIMSEVYESDLTDVYEVAVMLALANHADDKGVCYPSIRRIAQLARMGERGVQGVLKRLADRGYLAVKMNAGPSGCNVYKVQAAPAPHAPRTPCTPAPDAPPPPHPIPNTPAPHAPETSGTVIETSNKDHFGSDPSFSRFWEEWPMRKIGRKKAEAAFKRLSRQNKIQAIANARGWSHAWRKQNATANDIHPTTYLNGHRWLDEFSSPANSDRDEKMQRWRQAAGG